MIELSILIGSTEGKVTLVFDKPVESVELDPADARRIAFQLLQTALNTRSYEFVTSDGVSPQAGIKCFRCGRTSYSPNDVKEKYCGWCHVFHEQAEMMPPTEG